MRIMINTHRGFRVSLAVQPSRINPKLRVIGSQQLANTTSLLGFLVPEMLKDATAPRRKMSWQSPNLQMRPDCRPR
jgi:hypothetical protein